jgi:hypothetical protein
MLALRVLQEILDTLDLQGMMEILGTRVLQEKPDTQVLLEILGIRVLPGIPDTPDLLEILDTLVLLVPRDLLGNTGLLDMLGAEEL